MITVLTGESYDALAMSRLFLEPLIVSSILIPIVLTWCGLVNRVVPDPYLDEVFHVRQALTYWHGQWTTWDPKITTPPVLYLCSWLLNSITQLLWGELEVDAKVLRLGNVLLLTCVFPWDLLKLLQRIRSGVPSNRHSAWRIHTALNICLFPVIFFFSGLYYTDLVSIHFVLQAYSNFFSRATQQNSWIPTVMLCVNGLLALGARQTNIFWVAIFLGGSELIRCCPLQRTEKGISISQVARTAWKEGAVYDVDLADLHIQDLFLFVLSIGLAVLQGIPRVLIKLSPYLFLLFKFGTFVLWNGGVVLGDKENHIASLHLPQMLYFWGYIMFFSWPLSVPYLLGTFVPHTLLPSFLQQSSSRSRLPSPILVIIISAAMTAAVYFNTIVHPFTLADNRHYVFYVFRILLRKPWIRFVAIPIYFLCAWLSIVTLGGSPTQSSPSPPPQPVEPHSSTQVRTLAQQTSKLGKPAFTPKPTSSPTSSPSPKLSLLLIYLLSTTLSLITAPLVEPRYFIIPWIIWRLHLPPTSFSYSTNNSTPKPMISRLLSKLPHTDYRLYIETVWYIIINLATGYMFLYRGFEWKIQEPGKVQRFMW